MSVAGRPETGLARAARPVLDRVQGDLRGSPIALLLADGGARVLDIRYGDVPFGREVAALGVAPGVRLGEADVGTNAVGTPLETRESLLLRGPEHPMPAFHGFTCYGHPIIHPVTRRVAGVLDLAAPLGRDDRLAPPLVRHLVAEIEQRLRSGAPDVQRRLLAAFQAAARRRDRRVVVLGHGLVLATQPALDLLDPADHAALRACAEQGRGTERLTLASGRVVRLGCTPVEGTDGALVDITIEPARHRPGPGRGAGWPLLIVGELGGGRTTEALAAAGAGAVTLDAAEIERAGEKRWTADAVRLLGTGGPPLVVENVQLLSGPAAAMLAARLRGAPRNVVLTSTSAPAPPVAIAVRCGERRELRPLRRRRHEIPLLAQKMLGEEAPRARLTAGALSVLAAQPWPGNLAELRQVIRAVAAKRSAGDVLPADLPASHRAPAPPDSPFRQAEREVIVTAIEAAGGNKAEAARALGVSRSTLYNRMKALRIP
ncbi:helix-turn-helix domain-containing protein [Amycolatopsis australiensis]|uniref:Transcriptional regulator of acetoin/glycerol metabolism n=1 Tax=Amycolatopsis australiensis TaxID=546364 RepID=A0A1K1S623_9PSEU|nr:helix-turn-helix domain-containing protein [Amycolatopsis australiensis]SFW79803.1 Transcriptional regulator of acetoin/glycerol metabolism [Amycolatopsis australiensis]